MKKQILTKANFKLFQSKCELWLEYWKIGDWEIEYEHVDIDDLALLSYHWGNHQATLKLATCWKANKVTDEAITKCARHEVFELLLVPLRELASEPGNWGLVDRECHSIIRRWENVLPIDIEVEE